VELLPMARRAGGREGEEIQLSAPWAH
jgi:hypothetical protein